MFFTKKPEPAPKPNPLGVFCCAVNEALRNATDNADWPLKVRIAKALEDFAAGVRLEIAVKRPL